MADHEKRVRTTINPPDALLKRMKHYAIDHDMEYQDVIAEALVEYMAKPRRKAGAS